MAREDERAVSLRPRDQPSGAVTPEFGDEPNGGNQDSPPELPSARDHQRRLEEEEEQQEQQQQQHVILRPAVSAQGNVIRPKGPASGQLWWHLPCEDTD